MISRLVFILFLIVFLVPGSVSASSNGAGRIYLDVEDKGQAWYVSPVDNKAYYLANGAVAYNLLREQGLGITNADLAKIPVGFENILSNYTEEDFFSIIEDSFDQLCDEEDYMCSLRNAHSFVKSGQAWDVVDSLAGLLKSFDDFDGDGLSYDLERALKLSTRNNDSDGDGFDDATELIAGYNPLGPGRLNYDKSLVDRLKGRILLQVEGKGEAWYVNPADGKRYYMADGLEAYKIMSRFGIGAKTSFINGLDKDENSKVIADSLSRLEVECLDIECVQDGVRNRGQFTGVLEYTDSLQELGDFFNDQSLVGRFAIDYIGMDEYDLMRLRAIQFRSDNLSGEDLINIFAELEILPEGMTTEEKAEAGRLIFEMKEYIIGGLQPRMPELVCVVYDNEGLDGYLQDIDGILRGDYSGPTFEFDLEYGIYNDNEVINFVEEEFSGLIEYFEGDAIYCSVQGGLAG